jgi:hypothetical protein
MMETVFIEGWLTDCFARGVRPVYGYPSSKLPETSGGDMEVVTGFMANGPSATQVAEAA